MMKTCTHLIAKEPQGRKYEFAMKWGIKVVSTAWLMDSVKMTMRMDEAYYSLDPKKSPGQYFCHVNMYLSASLSPHYVSQIKPIITAAKGSLIEHLNPESEVPHYIIIDNPPNET